MKFPWYKYEELPVSKRNTLQMFITNRCDLNCEGCFAKAVMGTNGGDMTLIEYYNTVELAVKKKVSQINILGGEPLLHSKLDSMCLYNLNSELSTTVYTNGNYLQRFEPMYYHGAKLRVSLDSFIVTDKSIVNLIKTNKDWVPRIDANFMVTDLTTASELFNAANVLEDYGCKVFFISSYRRLENNADFFINRWDDMLPGTKDVLRYKKIVHKFLEMYNGNMEIHVSKRGVFESTLNLPHCKCKFANYFIGGKIIQCPYDVANLKYQDDYKFDTRFCQQNNTCLMSKIKLQRRK